MVAYLFCLSEIFYSRGFWWIGNRVLHTLARGLPQQQFKKTISRAVTLVLNNIFYILATSSPHCQMCCEMTDPWPLWQGTLAAWWRTYTGPSSTAASSCTPPQVSVRNLQKLKEGNCILSCKSLRWNIYFSTCNSNKEVPVQFYPTTREHWNEQRS